jgi:hypothetical protein
VFFGKRGIEKRMCPRNRIASVLEELDVYQIHTSISMQIKITGLISSEIETRY